MKTITSKIKLIGGMLSFMIAIIVGITVYINHVSKQDSVVVNVAGKQRMLSQKITKEILWLHSHYDSDRVAVLNHSMNEFEALFGQGYAVGLLQRYWIHMGGRALETFRPHLAKKSASEICDENTGGCAAELLNTQHFHLDLFGNYIPGLCSGLSIKREDLAQPLSAKKYPVLTTLFDRGIRGIFKMAQENFDYAPAKDSYINKCDLCTEIRTLFVQNNFGGAAELNPRQFYKNP